MKKIFTSSDNFPWHGKQRLAGKLPAVRASLSSEPANHSALKPGAGSPSSPAKPEFKDTLNSTDQSDSQRLPGSRARWAPLLRRACGPGPHTQAGSSQLPTFGVNGAGAHGCCPRRGPPVLGEGSSPAPSPSGPASPAPPSRSCFLKEMKLSSRRRGLA